jgi:hypothetical protein
LQGPKKFGHSLGPSVDKKNESRQMNSDSPPATYHTPLMSAPRNFRHKMLTVLLKPSPTKPGMGPAGNFGLLLFFNRTSHLGLDAKN